MEGKKISFGFTKTKKENKPLIVEKKDYIECVEEKSIKLVGGEIKDETKPLVIPMKPNTLITAERLKKIAEKAENFDEPESKDLIQEENKSVPKIESLDQMVVRELLEGAKKENVVEKPNIVVPINVKPVIDGQAEATLDDYESVPIQEYGMAMLRGMGWMPNKDQSKYKQPQLRPKGLGLGADKVITDNQKKKSKDKEEELAIVKNSFVKITTGKHSGYYGKVVSLDEDNGRVMVDITIKKETVSLSEFMMQAVTKSEFDKQSKVINAESYEEYKKKEVVNSKQNNPRIDDARSASSSKKSNDVRDLDRRDEDRYRRKDHSNGRSTDRNRRYSCSSEDCSRHRKKNKKKYSSNESLSTDSDKPKHTRHDSSSDSSGRKKNKSRKEKKDIDKKRKGKKKKRDRDRSPNYKKYRK